MEFWKDTKEAVSTMVKLQEVLANDPEVGKGMKNLNILYIYDCSEDGSDAKFWVDARNGQAKFGAGEPTEEVDLRVTVSLDNAHKAFQNKLNPILAVSTGKLKVKGKATGFLKMAGNAKRVAELYRNLLTELGMADKILK